MVASLNAATGAVVFAPSSLGKRSSDKVETKEPPTESQPKKQATAATQIDSKLLQAIMRPPSTPLAASPLPFPPFQPSPLILNNQSEFPAVQGWLRRRQTDWVAQGAEALKPFIGLGHQAVFQPPFDWVATLAQWHPPMHPYIMRQLRTALFQRSILFHSKAVQETFQSSTRMWGDNSKWISPLTDYELVNCLRWYGDQERTLYQKDMLLRSSAQSWASANWEATMVMGVDSGFKAYKPETMSPPSSTPK